VRGQMRHKGLFITGLFLLLIIGSFLVGMVMYLMMGGESYYTGLFGEGAVGVVTVEGPIISSEDVIEDLEQFRRDDGVKSIVLRVDSPGGAVAASQEIYEAVRRVADKKPVIASMGTVAASGGYYVSCGATKIYANPGTTTGSIGVRLEHIMIGELLKWARIGHETLKSGRLKDMMPLDKPISPEARKILQGVLDEIHQQFKKVVMDTRKIDPDKLDEIADGRIFTGEQAFGLGLVDALGGFTTAVSEAGKLGGIKGEPKIVRPKRHNRFLDRLMSEAKIFLARESMKDYLQPMFMMGTY